jgi:hypothetical protein
VDNFAGMKVLGRSVRVDHCETYRLPKELLEKQDQENSSRRTNPGHAYEGKDMANEFSIQQGQDLFAKPTEHRSERNDTSKEAKQARKEERDRIRKEREYKRELKEEKRRKKRVKRYDENDEEDEERSKKKKRKSKDHREGDYR